jgi:hypothetical protein
MCPQPSPKPQAQRTPEARSASAREVIDLDKHGLAAPSRWAWPLATSLRTGPASYIPTILQKRPQAETDLVSVVFVSGSLGMAPSTITSAHSPWQRMARAKQFASRIAKSLDQKGVIMRSSIRMAQPWCSLTTLNVIMMCQREWAAKSSVLRNHHFTPDDRNYRIIQPRGGSAALIYVKCSGGSGS